MPDLAMELQNQPAVIRPWAEETATTRVLTRENSVQFGIDVRDAINCRWHDVIALDCRGTGYISSFGLGAIVRAAKQSKEAGRRFVVVGLNDDLTTLFALLKLEQVVEVVTEAQWVDAGGDL